MESLLEKAITGDVFGEKDQNYIPEELP